MNKRSANAVIGFILTLEDGLADPDARDLARQKARDLVDLGDPTAVRLMAAALTIVQGRLAADDPWSGVQQPARFSNRDLAPPESAVDRRLETLRSRTVTDPRPETGRVLHASVTGWDMTTKALLDLPGAIRFVAAEQALMMVLRRVSMYGGWDPYLVVLMTLIADRAIRTDRDLSDWQTDPVPDGLYPHLTVTPIDDLHAPDPPF